MRFVVHVGALALVIILFRLLDVADAQPSRGVPKVGYLDMNEPEGSRWREGFARGLRDLGYVQGQSIVVDQRGYSTNDQLHQILNELVRLKVDVIFVGPPAAAIAAKQASGDIPIVCGSCGDPVANGLAASLAKPGGNVTGLASLSAELIGKRVAFARVILEQGEKLPRPSDYYRQYGGFYRDGRRVVYVCGLHRGLVEMTGKTMEPHAWMRKAMGADDAGLWVVSVLYDIDADEFSPVQFEGRFSGTVRSRWF